MRRLPFFLQDDVIDPHRCRNTPFRSLPLVLAVSLLLAKFCWRWRQNSSVASEQRRNYRSHDNGSFEFGRRDGGRVRRSVRCFPKVF